MLKRAVQCLESARKLYLVCHVIPDGDAIGSLLAAGLTQVANDLTVAGEPAPAPLLRPRRR